MEIIKKMVTKSKFILRFRRRDLKFIEHIMKKVYRRQEIYEKTADEAGYMNNMIRDDKLRKARNDLNGHGDSKL